MTSMNITGKKVADVTVSKDLFGTTVNKNLLNLAVRIYLDNQRQATKYVQRRGDVTATKKKAYRQKGTGNARHGAKSAPIFRGGGKAHGPIGNENYKKTLSKRMRKQALLSALSSRVADCVVVKDTEKIDEKTKASQAFVDAVAPKARRVLVVLDDNKSPLIAGTKNIANVATTQAARLNVYELLLAEKIIIADKALKVMEETYLGSIKSKTAKVSSVKKKQAAPKKEEK